MSLAIQEAARHGGLLTNLCQMAGVSRACYYRGLVTPDPVDKNSALRENIQQVALDCSCYGYRRVTKELHRQGVPANHKRVLRLMRQDNLLCLRKKRFVATTDSDHGLPVYPNLAADMDITAPDQLWISDLDF
jgi:putative transposase